MNRRLISVLVALVLATVGTAAVLLYLRAADDRAIEGKQVRTVQVAAKSIPAGTTGRALRENGYLREVRMPAETLPGDALEKIETVLDTQVTTAPVQKGQLMLRAMFGTALHNGGGLVVPEDQMAITARVKSAVFGPAALQAGMRVAIFYTYTPLNAENRNIVSGAGLERGRNVISVTRLLMTNVEVISVGPVAANDGQADGVVSGGNARAEGELSVTFGLSQVDAERLAHAVALGGELNIGLLGESSNVKPDNGVDNRTLFGGSE
jgi:pilus assembly protein CpaB